MGEGDPEGHPSMVPLDNVHWSLFVPFGMKWDMDWSNQNCKTSPLYTGTKVQSEKMVNKA